MAPPANSNASNAGAPTGCFKCGRPGHWSRDCPSSSSASPSFAAGPSSSTQQQKQPSSAGNPKSSAPWKSGKPPLKPAPTRPNLPRKRPKLTPDLLLSNDGLGYVLEHFPRMVKIKGAGHEVEDLKSFLEAYVHWHSRILPYFSFNQFVEKVGKVGASKRVRMCVHDLKNKVARGDDLKLSPEDSNPECAQADNGLSSHDDDIHQDGDPWEEDHHDTLPADINEDVFDEFYKQAVEEPSDVIPQTSLPNVSLPEPAFKDVAPSPAQLAPSSISEDQKLRMEANRLKALERAKARVAAPIAM